MLFNLHIGVNYSGGETPTSGLASLQVYSSENGFGPYSVLSPASTPKLYKNWSRREIANWLIGLSRKEDRFIVGIDHAFSFPISYFERYGLKRWPEFLDDFAEHWPTDSDHKYVDFIMDRGPTRIGSSDEFRLTELRAKSSRSVFRFDGHGSIAKATHAGIPWIRRIRMEAGKRIHFWPFDGWKVPDGKSVIVEVDPTLFRRDFPKGSRTKDQHDAFATSKWLSDLDERGSLVGLFEPPLSVEERKIARQEGWILGIR